MLFYSEKLLFLSTQNKYVFCAIAMKIYEFWLESLRVSYIIE